MNSTDIRDLLRRDHAMVLAALEALRSEPDARRSLARLDLVRRNWIIHALAEETVVYRAIEGAEGLKGSKSNADERFIEHELVEGLFEKLSRTRPGSQEWMARVSVARELIARHIEHEHESLFARLAKSFDADALREIGHRFRLAGDKLRMLEEAKAA
jgi:hemerythrin-like domain-containing protein